MKTGIAITVRYAGPTNYRDSRWIARADRPEGRAVVSYDHSLPTGIENAKRAAYVLVERWNSDRDSDYRFVIIAGGHTTEGYAFIAILKKGRDRE